MLVVLSDLHFSEAQSTRIGNLTFNKNLDPEIYRAYLREINQIALSNQIRQVDLVLAGDIFEITRSAIWFDGPYRPYVDNRDVEPGSPLEAKILQILDAIAVEDKVKETLLLFRTLEERFDVDVRLHYVVGNHDRLLNATPELRRKARALLGVGGGDLPLIHQFIYQDEEEKSFCLVRHGHEYDPMNFSVDTHALEVIPTEFSEDIYGNAPLGDIITIEFGAALPNYFVEHYGEERIISNPILMALYQRLMDFDDVRPTSALLSYLFATPGVPKKQTWEFMLPCFTRTINALSEIDLVFKEIEENTSINKSQRLLLEGVLNSDLLKNGLPYWTVKQLMKQVSKKIKLNSQARWAKREALIQDPETGCQCVIGGHTHIPEVSLLSARQGDEQYYINTGTWRNVVPATKDFKAFGKLNATTKVMVFHPNEIPAEEGSSPWSFQYLSGFGLSNHRHL
ncbi:metallophosphoesterase [Chloroflexota bacterium]|nr:metallophosphoesterase [Chloroflexota bacterium]